MKRKMAQWNNSRRLESDRFAYFLLLIFVISIFTILFFFPTKNDNSNAMQQSPIIVEINIDTVDWILAIDYIKNAEAFSPKPYSLSGNQFIGYGHMITNKESFGIISEEQATKIMEDDLLQCIRYASIRYHLTGNQAFAVGMLFYGTKHSIIFKSQLHTELCKGPDKWNEQMIKDSWISFCMFNGKQHQKIKARRQYELNLFLKK